MQETSPRRADARTRLLDAALTVIRTRGYAGTTVDELCAAAGVTKGAFFHHFRSKEELGVAAAVHFGTWLDALFGGMPCWQTRRIRSTACLAYIDFRIAISRGSLPHFTCLLGIMVQETYATHPAIRAACEAGISVHAAPLAERCRGGTMQARGMTGLHAQSLAFHTQAVIQGAFVLAKAMAVRQLAVDSLLHLRRYIELLFAAPRREEADAT